MKKKISMIGIIVGIIIGIITTIIWFYLEYKKDFSVAIIGGADGPTSVIIAGKVGEDFSTILIIVGVVVICIAIAVLKIQKRG
jgi:oxaloacetate decarboxylase beta subunit